MIVISKHMAWKPSLVIFLDARSRHVESLTEQDCRLQPGRDDGNGYGRNLTEIQTFPGAKVPLPSGWTIISLQRG
jgi:hypothetical protein